MKPEIKKLWWGTEGFFFLARGVGRRPTVAWSATENCIIETPGAPVGGTIVKKAQ